jgi:leucine dehydrogenase
MPRLKCDIVAGSANNQLATTECGDELDRRGILYVPDYAINAGGVMNVAIELQGYDRERANRMVSTIYDIIETIFRIAERDSIPTWKAADRLAEERIAAISRVKLLHVKQPSNRLAGRTRSQTAE